MKVHIETKIENSGKPAVYISAGETMYSIEQVAERIRAMQMAKAWLTKELKSYPPVAKATK